MNEKALKANFRTLVRAYMQATGQSETAVSKIIYGNAGFLGRFFNGDGSVSVKKFCEMVETIRARWPHEAPWPMLSVIVLKPPPKGRIAPLSPRTRTAA